MTDTTTTPNEAEAVTEQALGELEHLDPNDLQVGLTAHGNGRSRRSR